MRSIAAISSGQWLNASVRVKGACAGTPVVTSCKGGLVGHSSARTTELFFSSPAPFGVGSRVARQASLFAKASST